MGEHRDEMIPLLKGQSGRIAQLDIESGLLLPLVNFPEEEKVSDNIFL